MVYVVQTAATGWIILHKPSRSKGATIAILLIDRIEGANASSSHTHQLAKRLEWKWTLNLDGPEGLAQRLYYWRPFAPCFACAAKGQVLLSIR